MARKRFNFWLDDNRADDWSVNELITSLKKKKQFTRAIREGLRLWADLRDGNTTVLCELFPQFKDKLNPPAAPSAGGVGGSDLAKQIAEQIVLMNGTPGYLMQSAQPSPAMPTGNLPAVPVAVAVQSSKTVSADEIADGFLGMLSMFD